jgi:hypothetical protein
MAKQTSWFPLLLLALLLSVPVTAAAQHPWRGPYRHVDPAASPTPIPIPGGDGWQARPWPSVPATGLVPLPPPRWLPAPGVFAPTPIPIPRGTTLPWPPHDPRAIMIPLPPPGGFRPAGPPLPPW